MDKKYVFLFPGQGAQTPGMMKDVCEASDAAKSCLSRLSQAADEDISALLWESDAATLARSDRSQLSIMAASLIMAAVLEEKGIRPNAVAGFSLGEFPALCLSGVLSFEDTVRVVKERGNIMQRVCEAIATRSAGRAPGMAAVIGLSPEKIAEVTASCSGVYAANLNSVRQTVVSGTADGLDKAESLFKEAGARRVVRLAVAGPYHCPLMQEAADEFEKTIASITFADPKIALFSNVTGQRATNGAEIKKNAVLHLVKPVLWTNEENALAELMKQDTATSESVSWSLLEVGPGKVLSGLWGDTPFTETWSAASCGTLDALNSVV